MKPILLLGPVQPGGPPQERWLVELRRATPVEEALAEATGYAAVVVINDGSAHTIERLLTALGMRERWEELHIALLSYLNENDRQLPALIDLAPRLKLELRGEALRLEYQAV